MQHNEHTEMQLKYQDSWYPSVIVTTPTVGKADLHHTAANEAIIKQKFHVLNMKWYANASVVLLEQNRAVYQWFLNTGPCGYDNYMSDLHQHSAVQRIRVQHDLVSQPTILISMIHPILQSCQDHPQCLTEDVVMLLRDELASWILRMVKSRYVSLDIQPIQYP